MKERLSTYAQAILHSSSSSSSHTKNHNNNHTVVANTTTHEPQGLLNPRSFYLPHPTLPNHLIMPMPKSLSPSSISTYKQCPQAFFFQYILKLPQLPKTTVLAKGLTCHSALEELYDPNVVTKPQERTLEVLKNLFRSVWSRVRFSADYQHLFTTTTTTDDDQDDDPSSSTQRDVEAERQWGIESLQLLENYYHMEDPKTVTDPNPLRCEV